MQCIYKKLKNTSRRRFTGLQRGTKNSRRHLAGKSIIRGGSTKRFVPLSGLNWVGFGRPSEESFRTPAFHFPKVWWVSCFLSPCRIDLPFSVLLCNVLPPQYLPARCDWPVVCLSFGFDMCSDYVFIQFNCITEKADPGESCFNSKSGPWITKGMFVNLGNHPASF